MWLTLIALVVPLGLDTFAIAAALGMSGLTRQDRIRVTALFTGFEMGMPVVGIVLGAVAGNVVGKAADYVAIVILIGLGIFMLWPPRDDRDEPERVGLLARTSGLAALRATARGARAGRPRRNNDIRRIARASYAIGGGVESVGRAVSDLAPSGRSG